MGGESGSLGTWLLVGGGVVAVVGIGWFVYLAAVLAWADARTNGLDYYGLGAPERARFKRVLRTHALLLFPLVRVLGRLSSFRFENASFDHEGVAGPKGTCDADSFARGAAYRPRPEDVFVVTQMKCGTTWMQHVVFQVLHRGHGDLVESGTALYAVSPWLEARKSVAVDEARLVGTERPSRIIKTHFPVALCPYGPLAKYVYVARHPVSCLASCTDFITTNVGSFAPDATAIEEWFVSDDMWWGTWPEHVAGWGARAREMPNVLFVRFEDMKADLPEVVRRVASFLDVEPLADAELEEIVRKCSFEYMSRHPEAFEMHPPHLLQTEAELFVRGAADRHRDVPDERRRRVLEWCGAARRDDGFPLDELYPEIGAP